MELVADYTATIVSLVLGIAFAASLLVLLIPLLGWIGAGIMKVFSSPQSLSNWWVQRKVRTKHASSISAPEQNFSHLRLAGTDFHDSYLPRANFAGSDLREVNFTHTNLIHANFTDCDLTNADFTEADLQEADLRSARLVDCKLDEANLSGALFNPETRLPFPRERARAKGMVFVA